MKIYQELRVSFDSANHALWEIGFIGKTEWVFAMGMPSYQYLHEKP